MTDKKYEKPQVLPIVYDEAIAIIAKSERCSKLHCHYCDLMNRPDRGDISTRKNGWTANELAKLERDYPLTDVSELTRILNRSAKAIWRKAGEIGVRKVKKSAYRVSA